MARLDRLATGRRTLSFQAISPRLFEQPSTPLPDGDGVATRALAEFASELRFESLPGPVATHGKLSLLDTLGVALAGAGQGEGCAEVIAYATSQAESGPARVWASGQRLPAGLASLCNASHARALDYDDIIENPQIHVAVCVVPAALAVAEASHSRVDGKTLIAALVAGAEIQSRLANAIAGTLDPSTFPVMLSSQVFGYFSAAAAAGHVLKLGRESMLSALGLAMMQASGTEELVVHAPVSVGKVIYAGLSNQAGVQSAQMAAHGVLASGNALEGKAGLLNAFYGGRYRSDALTSELGERYVSLDCCFKAMPGTLVSHAFVEAALTIVRRESLATQDIAEICLHVGGWGRTMSEPLDMRRHPPTASAGMNSIPYMVATALTKGAVSLDAFTAAGRADAATYAMAEKIVPVHDARLNNPHGLEPGLVDIVATDGRILSQRVDKPRGHPSRPLSFDDVAAKFNANAAMAALPHSSARIDQIITCVERLDRLNDVRTLIDLVAPDKR